MISEWEPANTECDPVAFMNISSKIEEILISVLEDPVDDTLLWTSYEVSLGDTQQKTDNR